MGPRSLPSLTLDRLSVRSVRNLRHVELEPAPRFNVIAGSNGHGKTSLLEAIYFAATSRSFRTSRLVELLAHGEGDAYVKARFTERSASPLSREQLALIHGKRTSVRVDGNPPSSLASFATRSPVVVFHPDELTLSSGPAAGRRTLLDRVALFIDPLASDHRHRYTHAMRARQHLLRAKDKDLGSSRGDLDAFEQLAAVHGAALTASRRRATEALLPELTRAFAEVAAPGLLLGATYVPGGSEDAAEGAAELRERRPRDVHRPSPGFGPHRDDLDLRLAGHAARTTASQGQHRVLTLALKAAEAACIAEVRGLEPILLLDDVSSELDAGRTLALFHFLDRARGQIFLTTTRPDLIVTPSVAADERADFELIQGAMASLR